MSRLLFTGSCIEVPNTVVALQKSLFVKLVLGVPVFMNFTKLKYALLVTLLLFIHHIRDRSILIVLHIFGLLKFGERNTALLIFYVFFTVACFTGLLWNDRSGFFQG